MISNETNNVIDLRDKSLEEIFDVYKDIGNDTEIVSEIWRNTNDLDDALEVYKQVKEKLD